MKLLLSEVLEQVDKAKTKEEKIKILKSNESPALRGIMRINFDTSVNMALPEGTPPYNKITDVPIGEQQTKLISEYRRFYIWLDPKINLTRMKKESLFIEMLEGLHHSEAELICLAKDKKLHTKYKTVKEDLIREVFPATLPPKQVKVVDKA